jgi:tetratricopeptide (TPR) repeat protein
VTAGTSSSSSRRSTSSTTRTGSRPTRASAPPISGSSTSSGSPVRFSSASAIAGKNVFAKNGRALGPAVLVFTAAFLAYAPNLGNGFVYDDRLVIERNPLVQGLDFGGLVKTSYWGDVVDAGLYRPLTLLSFGLNRALSPSPMGFHVTNNFLHGLASVLALIAASSLGLHRAGSLAAGLLFALHPVQSEAVNSIVGRAEILAFSFAVLSFLLYRREARPLWVGSTFLLALLSKESAAFALPWFAVYRAKPPRFHSLGAALALYALLRIAVLGGAGISGRAIGFLDNPVASAGVGTRAMTAPVLVLEYARLALWPRVLSADYSFDRIPVPASLLDGRVIAGTVVSAALALLALRFRVMVFLLPLAGFLHLLFPVGTILAERLFYLPMLGVALGFGLALGRPRWPERVLLALVSVLCLLRVEARIDDWRDNETLFRRTVATTPSSARSHFLLGAELVEKKNFREAARSFENGLAILPDHFGARMSLGGARLAAGDAAGAEEAFRLALELEPRSEDARRGVIEAALALGRERARAEDFDAARGSFERALDLDPNEPSAWNYLGLVSEREGRGEEARRHYERALEIDRDHLPALLNLASLRMRAEELSAAEEAYRHALALEPDSYEGWNGLGIALARQGRREEAAAAFERAIALDPNLPAARENLRALR